MLVRASTRGRAVLLVDLFLPFMYFIWLGFCLSLVPFSPSCAFLPSLRIDIYITLLPLPASRCPRPYPRPRSTLHGLFTIRNTEHAFNYQNRNNSQKNVGYFDIAEVLILSTNLEAQRRKGSLRLYQLSSSLSV